MKNPWMSIIIPMYNPPINQLEICLKSLEAILIPIEIILIDDGSGKKTKEFCDNYEDKRIKYVYQENQGVSSARNKGIKIATGKYIFFLDADDYIPAEFCEFINMQYENICEDWILFNTLDRNPVTGEIQSRNIFQQNINVRREDLLGYVYPTNKIPESWGKLIKRNLLEFYKITVPVGIIQGEDAIFNKRIAAVVETVKVYTCHSYVYNAILQNSIRLAKQPEKYLKGLKESFLADLEYIATVSDIEQKVELDKIAYTNFIWNMGSNMIKLCQNGQFDKKNIAIINQNLKETLVLQKIQIKELYDIKSKLYYILFKYQLWFIFKVLAFLK